MTEKLKIGTSSSVNVDATPSKCPHCHHNMVPTWRFSVYGRENQWIEAAYTCVHPECRKIFIASFYKPAMRSQNLYILKKLSPSSYIPPILPQEIKDLSPSFDKIYAQATQAEASGLDEIAGVGYRKAFEFLIKDFCISQSPEKESEIKGKFLGKVINDYIEDPNIITCSKRASWLGNDETHYIRKWSDKDINDLKILIKLTCGWIENNILTQKYLEEMAETRN